MMLLWRTWVKQRDKQLRSNAFSSVNRYEPPRVKAVREKSGEKAAKKMKIAIALDEARKMGVKA